MLITTKENIKKELGISISDHDVLLLSIAAAVSAHLEREMRRLVESKERTEYFDIEQRQTTFWLKAFPVSACVVYNDYDRAFGASTIVPACDYTILGDRGQLSVDKFELTAGPKMLKVVYTGGLGASQATLEADYPDLEMAARIQGAYWFQNRNKLGIVGEGIAGASVTHYQRFELLPTVKEIIASYRRVAF